MGGVAIKSEERVAGEFAAAIKNGDQLAEAPLVERYSRGVMFLLKRLTGDAVLAEDLHQDTFRVVLERLRGKGLEEPEKLAGFIRNTARYLVIDHFRKAARRKTFGDSEAVERVIDATPGQVEQLVRIEESRMVRRVIDSLKTDRDRQILYRFYIAEEDKEVICADLGLSDQHFNRVLFRARERFKYELERQGYDSGGAAP